MSKDRDAYLAECKARALKYLPRRADAIASIMSDLSRHPDFESVARAMTPLALHYAIRGDEEDARRFIVGFR